SPILASRSRRCRALGRVAHHLGASLSDATRACDRSIRARWSDGYIRPPDRAKHGGNVGMGQGARAAPDGHTILVVPPNFVVNPALYNKVPYDPCKDFDPVTIAVTAPPVLTVHPLLPVQTVRDLVGFIKSSSGKYNFASGGTGTPGHLVGEQFR